MKTLLMQEAPEERHLVFMATVSHTGHQGWYSMRVLPTSGGTRATRALAAPTRAKMKAAVCMSTGVDPQPQLAFVLAG